MDDIGKILPSLFRKQIRRDEPRLLEILLPLWPRIAGKTMAQHSQPAFYSAGVLTLTTDCAVWSKQLRHLAEDIRTGINGFLGHPIVKKLRIKRVEQTGLFDAPRALRRAALPAPALAQSDLDTTSIADPEIVAALANSYAKYFTRRGREN